MVSHPSRRALAFGAAVSLGIACIAPSQAAFAVEKAPAIPLVRPAVLSAAVTAAGRCRRRSRRRPRAGARSRGAASSRAGRRTARQAPRLRPRPHRRHRQPVDGRPHHLLPRLLRAPYGDAILTGQANDHGAYGCGCCTWPGWGGGNSSFRSLGSDEALLREAYDEIAAGRPTVVHVAGPYGEHWICLMGYQGVEDPDALSLDNFIALDPANGLEVTASYRYAPYGDACEHVSDLR